MKWLRELLQESPIPQVIIWLDCCYSGELMNFQDSLTEADPGNLEGKSRCFITACREFEAALMEPTGNFSILTKALLQGLDPTQQPDGWVTSHSLVEWIERELSRDTQRPICHNSYRTILLTNNQFKKEVGDCPYKGLQYFDIKDGELFYGRDALTDTLIKKVKNRNFIAVLGESGFGKSSVIRAGLLYRLKLGQSEGLSGSDRWQFYDPFAPGEHPLQRLKEAIGREANQLGELIASATTERVVLVVDQFEETFTLCQDRREREEFFDCLLDAMGRVGNKLCLILGMRSDFLGECTKYAKLASQIKETENLVIVMPIDDPQELRKVIVEPAQKVGLQVEPRLVIKMIEDIKVSPSRLPLLQDALEGLWLDAQTKPDKNILTFSAYEELGGIEKALEKRANQVYELLLQDENGNPLSEEEGITRQEIAKRIFWELTYVGEETEVKVTIKSVGKDRLLELVTNRESSEVVDRVIRELEQARLIVTNKVGVVGIAHQALIGNWEKLRQWVAANPEAKRKKQKIEAEAEEWEAKRKSKDYLLTGERLVEAEGFFRDYGESFPLSVLEREFVKKSREESDRLATEEEERRQRELDISRQSQNRLRWIIGLLSSGLAITVSILARPYLLRLWVTSQTEMVEIPAGEAIIGTEDPQVTENEKPLWHIKLPSFQIEKFKVSNRQYRLCIWAGVCTDLSNTSKLYNLSKLDEPVHVPAFQAAKYCQWLGRELPTELEWERAARGSEGDELSSYYHKDISPDGVHNLVEEPGEWTRSISDPEPQKYGANYNTEMVWDYSKPDVSLIIRVGEYNRTAKIFTTRYSASVLTNQIPIEMRCVKYGKMPWIMKQINQHKGRK